MFNSILISTYVYLVILGGIVYLPPVDSRNPSMDYGSVFSEKPVVVYKSFLPKLLSNHLFLLKWETLSESQNLRFIIERSSDNHIYDSLAYVGGSMESNRLLSYSYTDNSPLLGTSYYRLKHVGPDGQYNYSETLKVVFHGNKKSLRLLNAVPQHFKSQVTVSFEAPDPGQYDFILYNLAGEVMFSAAFEARAETASYTFIDSLDLIMGTYIGAIKGSNGEFGIVELVKEE